MKFNRNIAYTNKIFLLTKAIYVVLKSRPYNDNLDNKSFTFKQQRTCQQKNNEGKILESLVIGNISK